MTKFVDANYVTKISKLVKGMRKDKICVEDCSHLISECLQVLNEKLDELENKISIVE